MSIPPCPEGMVIKMVIPVGRADKDNIFEILTSLSNRPVHAVVYLAALLQVFLIVKRYD